jgi:prophage maintenance system killer protein
VPAAVTGKPSPAIYFSGSQGAHGFEQGNKRTGFEAALMFLSLNGYSFVAPDMDELGKLVEKVIERELSQEEFTEIIRPFVVPIYIGAASDAGRAPKFAYTP